MYCSKAPLIVQSRMDGGMTPREKYGSAQRKTCPSATLFTTNRIWTSQGSNLSVHGEKPATSMDVSACQKIAYSFNVIPRTTLKPSLCQFNVHRLALVHSLFIPKPPPGVSPVPFTFIVLAIPFRGPRHLQCSDTKGGSWLCSASGS
jgi:hypothetical protein